RTSTQHGDEASGSDAKRRSGHTHTMRALTETLSLIPISAGASPSVSGRVRLAEYADTPEVPVGDPHSGFFRPAPFTSLIPSVKTVTSLRNGSPSGCRADGPPQAF